MNQRVLFVGGVLGVVGVAVGCGGKTREDASRAGTGGSSGHGDVENQSGTEAPASRAGGSPGAGGGSAAGGSASQVGGGVTGGSAAIPGPVGRFVVELFPDVATTTVTGRVFEAPPPDDMIWELTDGQGDCQLLEPRVPFCDPACENSICVEDDQCAPVPARRSVGTVTVQGLQLEGGGTEFTINPIGANPAYATAQEFAYPPFAEGDTVSVETSGGDYAPFQIESQGISPLEVLGGDEVPLETGQPVTLQWTPAGLAGVSRIRVVLNISHYGGQKGEIVCDTEDTGSLEIPASLATQLLELGYSGFPTIVIERRAVGSVENERGRVELVVNCLNERPVSIPGLISCNENSDCPEGQACQVAHLLCR
jgi:hypothetical protein